MLMFVLAVVLMLSIAAIALLRMTLTAGNVASGLSVSTRTLHAIDGSMEKAVNEFRNDTLKACDGSATNYGTYKVACTDVVFTTAPAPAGRTMTFLAEKGTGEVAGKARVRVVDAVNGQPSVGYSIEVCDWLLGAASVDEELRGCSA